jgi:hypothetical protein
VEASKGGIVSNSQQYLLFLKRRRKTGGNGQDSRSWGLHMKEGRFE